MNGGEKLEEKELKQIIARAIDENVVLGEHGKSLSTLSKRCDVTPNALQRAYQGDCQKISTACKILAGTGYALEIKKIAKSSLEQSKVGIRIDCCKCGYIERHRKAETFLRSGWAYDTYHDGFICPMCFEQERQSYKFIQKFKEMEKIEKELCQKQVQS